MIYWFTGQSGSGKTTLAKELGKHLDNVKYIDGDVLSEAFGNDNYRRLDRENNVALAQTIAAFSLGQVSMLLYR